MRGAAVGGTARGAGGAAVGAVRPAGAAHGTDEGDGGRRLCPVVLVPSPYVLVPVVCGWGAAAVGAAQV